MPNDAVGDIVRVTIAVMCADQQVQENNMSYECTVAAVQDSRSALGLAVFNKFLLNYIAVMPPSALLYGYKVSSLNKAPATQPVWNVIVGNIGTGTNPTAPTQARPIIRFSTALAGRKYRGRMYLPTPSGALVQTSGFPTAAMTAAAQALATSLLSPIILTGTTWRPGIAHRVKGLPASTTITQVLGAVAPGMFATQRRSGNTGRMNPVPW